MTREQVRTWARTKVWQFPARPEPLRYALNPLLGLMVCVTSPGYAECQGPGDPVCGMARFSSHGCGGCPSREEYLSAVSAEGLQDA